MSLCNESFFSYLIFLFIWKNRISLYQWLNLNSNKVTFSVTTTPWIWMRIRGGRSTDWPTLSPWAYGFSSGYRAIRRNKSTVPSYWQSGLNRTRGRRMRKCYSLCSRCRYFCETVTSLSEKFRRIGGAPAVMTLRNPNSVPHQPLRWLCGTLILNGDTFRIMINLTSLIYNTNG